MTTHTNQLIVYGYIDECTRTAIYKTFYDDTEKDFTAALQRCRKVKELKSKLFQEIEIVCFLTITMKVE